MPLKSGEPQIAEAARSDAQGGKDSRRRRNARPRVRTRAEFDRIQREGERVPTRHFVLILSRSIRSAQHPASPDGNARLGITASRKIGNAVVRNRAKRLVREAFRATADLWPAGVDLVVIVRKPPGALKLAGVVEEWRRASGPLRRTFRALLAAPPGSGKTPAGD